MRYPAVHFRLHLISILLAVHTGLTWLTRLVLSACRSLQSANEREVGVVCIPPGHPDYEWHRETCDVCYGRELDAIYEREREAHIGAKL